MGGAGPRRVLALALALATVALAGARDVARTDVGEPSEGTGGFTRTEGPRRALAQWTLPPRRAVPSPEDVRLPWRTSPRAAASAAMGSDNSAPLGEEEDHHETDGIPTTTSLTTDYDELDADYFARRAESEIVDPLDRQLERWYRTTDELEAPLPESRRVEAEEEREEEAKAPTETDDASPLTVGLDRGDEIAAGKKPPSSETEETGANATSFVTATNASSETKHERGDKRAAGEKLGWLEAQLEEKAEKKEARSRNQNDTRVSFDAVELYYADVTDPRRPVGEAIYQGPREGGKKATDARRTAFDDALEDARFDVTTEELERDEAEYRAWAAARDSARENENDGERENDGSAETGDDAVTSEADAVVDAIVADAEALRERARKMFRRNTTSEHDEAQSQNEAAEAQSQNEAAEAQSQKQKVARDVAARVTRDAEDRGAKSEMAAEAIAAVASDDDSARRAIIAAAKRALEEDGVLPAGVTPEDITRGDAESEAESAPAEKEEKLPGVPVPPSNATASNATASNATASNATASSDGNGRRIPSLGAKRSKGGSKGTGSPSGTDRDLESSMFAASTDLKHASEEEGKAKAKKASSAATSKTASTKSSSSTKRTSRTSKSSKSLSRKESLSREEKEKEKEKAPTGPLSASEEIDAAMAALVAAAKTDADSARAQIDASEDSGDDSAYVAAVGTVIPQHDFGEEIRATSAEHLQTQRAEERVASSRLETLVVSAVAVGVVGFGFASLRDFLLRDRKSLDAAARLSDAAETGPAGEGALGAVSPASLLQKQKPEDRRKSEDERDAPQAKTPTKKHVATASPRAREKTPLLPK